MTCHVLALTKCNALCYCRGVLCSPSHPHPCASPTALLSWILLSAGCKCLGCNQHAHDMPCTDYRKITCTLMLQGHGWLPPPPQPAGQLDITHSLQLALCRSQCLECAQHAHDMTCTDSRTIQCTLQGNAWIFLPPPAAVQLIVTPSLGLDLCRSQLLGCTQHAPAMPCTDSHKMRCTLRLQGHAWLPLPPQPPGQLDMTPSLHLALCRSQCLGCTQHVNMP